MRETGFVLRPVPEGVASPDGRRLYVPALGGGVAAIDAATGEPRWQSSLGRIALVADKNRVLVLADAGAVQPRWLGAADGERTGADPPPWPAPAGEWWLDGSSLEDGRLVVAWHTRLELGRDAPPLLEAGAFALDLGAPRATVQPVEPAKPPAWPGREGVLPFIGAGGALPPWIAAGQVVAPGVRTLDGEPALVLCRRDGKRVDDVLLRPRLPKPGYLEVHDSPDASLLTFLDTNDAPVGDAPTGSISTWHLFSVPDGAPLAALPAEPGLLPPFTRVGSVLLARQLGAIPTKRQPPARALRAWLLPKCRPLWHWPLPAEAPNRIR